MYSSSVVHMIPQPWEPGHITTTGAPGGQDCQCQWTCACSVHMGTVTALPKGMPMWDPALHQKHECITASSEPMRTLRARPASLQPATASLARLGKAQARRCQARDLVLVLSLSGACELFFSQGRPASASCPMIDVYISGSCGHGHGHHARRGGTYHDTPPSIKGAQEMNSFHASHSQIDRDTDSAPGVSWPPMNNTIIGG